MTATDFVTGFIVAAKPTRVAVSRPVWARLIVENRDPLPFLPWPDAGTFCGIPIGPRARLQSPDQVCSTESPT